MKKTDLNYKGEFGPELQLVIPHAYYLHCRGLLGKTVSAKDTKALYYFSEGHEELYQQRVYGKSIEPPRNKLPNPDEHTFFLKTSHWSPPPYRAKYKNDRFKWDKEPLVISNKYCIEWGQGPFNYLDLLTLEKIFALLKRDYQLIYSRFVAQEVVDDHNTILDFGDHDLIEKYPEILTIQELHSRNPDLSYNALQLMVYANCEKFISVQGGNSVLASYFGGVNIIYAVKGAELIQGDYNHFSLYSGASICPCSDRESLFKSIKTVYAQDRLKFIGGFEAKALSLSLLMKYNIGIVRSSCKRSIRKFLHICGRLIRRFA